MLFSFPTFFIFSQVLREVLRAAVEQHRAESSESPVFYRFQRDSRGGMPTGGLRKNPGESTGRIFLWGWT